MVVAPWFIGTVLFVLGVSIGSFLHVVVWRTQHNFSIVSSRSRCDSCGHTLSWYELIPLVSYFVCRRKCRHCKNKLSSAFFWVELVTGVAFVLIYIYNIQVLGCNELSSACGAVFVRHIVFFCMLLVLFLSDLWYQTLPDMFTVPFILVLIFGVLVSHSSEMVSALIGMVVGAGIFLLQYLISRGKWIGSGDIFLGAIMGLMLGWPEVIVAIGLAYIAGAAVAVGLLMGKKKKRDDAIAFGTFLTTATFAMLFYSDQIMHWFGL